MNLRRLHNVFCICLILAARGFAQQPGASNTSITLANQVLLSARTTRAAR